MTVKFLLKYASKAQTKTDSITQDQGLCTKIVFDMNTLTYGINLSWTIFDIVLIPVYSYSLLYFMHCY